jgi:hypothetical protein
MIMGWTLKLLEKEEREREKEERYQTEFVARPALLPQEPFNAIAFLLQLLLHDLFLLQRGFPFASALSQEWHCDGIKWQEIIIYVQKSLSAGLPS